MDSGSEMDSFILSIAIFTIAGVITHFWDTHTALQVEPADLYNILLGKTYANT